MYIRLAGRGQQRQKLYLTLDGGKRREETARAAAEVEVEEVAVGWWQMEDGSWWRATRKTQFHFSFRKRQAKYKCKGKAKKRTKTWAQQRGIRDLSIAVQLMSCVCVCVWTHQKIDNDASWNMFFFRPNENKFMCDLQSATIWCEFRSTGFPCTTTHVTQAREEGGGDLSEWGAPLMIWTHVMAGG